MMDEILNFLLGLVDDTYDNDSDIDKRLKICEQEKMKRLRRK